MENKNEKLLVNGGYPLHTFEEVEELYLNYISSTSDKEMIREAYEFVIKMHSGQTRKSGEPYHHHLIEVAYIVASLQCGPATIVAALLHDVVEDTDVSIDYINEKWGADVAKIVDSLTKIQKLKLSKMQNEEFEAEDHRKIFLGMAKDIRVIIIKLADRLHNMRTLGALSKERQIAICNETMNVYVPIAHRLGLELIKREMQDIAISYLEPEKFLYIQKLLSKRAKTMGRSLDSIKKRIADILFEKRIPFEISSRVKSTFSIYEKMYTKGRNFEEIYDILALRIITDTDIQCYEILGLIHQTYKPVPGRFKDYIAMPKPNLYQSLHTTIVSGDGNFYEIQIRTKAMDEVAETGIAAHWAYKESDGYNPKEEQLEIENRLHWFRDFVSLSEDTIDNDAKEYVNNLTRDIFEANVYVFTPKGRVIELPQGSTPVDFAYKIHTKVGHNCIGAIVNGVMVPLSTQLKTGDMVEIKTIKTGEPNEGWLEFVKTSQAKFAIRKHIAKKNAELLRDDKIAKGRASLITAFKDRGYTEADMDQQLKEHEKKLLENFQVETFDDLYVAITNRNPSSSGVIEFLKIRRKKQIVFNKQEIKINDCPVYCKGVGKIAIALANCCRPIPGDEIVGYITRGKGITVHRKDCPNVAGYGERLVEVFWRDDLDKTNNYPVDILIRATDRNNLLFDVINVFSTHKISCNNVHARYVGNQGDVIIQATIMIPDLHKLREILNILLNVSSVYEVLRATH